MTVKEREAIASLEQLVEQSTGVQELAAERDRREARRAEVTAHVTALVDRQRELRRHLSEADTEAERAKARAAVATTAAEATILPDEATMANEAYALALHRWASARIAAVEDLGRRARGDWVRAYEELQAAHPGASSAKLAINGSQLDRDLQVRQRDLQRLRKRIVESCRPVFPHREFGTLSDDGSLRGHEPWLARQRTEIEEQLRA